jgi:hypothetical protein
MPDSMDYYSDEEYAQAVYELAWEQEYFKALEEAQYDELQGQDGVSDSCD